MRAVAPGFWARPPGVLAELLWPAGAVWSAAGRLRRALVHPYCPPIPVICVGNMVAGGAGKTPVTLALGADLITRGIAVHIVTRGYGGRLRGPVQVDSDCHDAAAVGDEALLLALRAPCWVARNRADGVRAAVAAGAQVVLLDDAFQNPDVTKTLSIVVVDAAYGLGNGRVIPAGPLRESVDNGLARADAVVLLKSDHAIASVQLPLNKVLPILPAVLSPIRGERLAGTRLLAFAGIGQPEKFFATLRALGAVLVGTRAFPDHHPFRKAEVERMIRDAERAQARLVTTAKDIVRVPSANHSGIEVLEVEVRWHDPAKLKALLMPLVSAAHRSGRGTADQLD